MVLVGPKVDTYAIIRSWERGREEGRSLQVHEKAVFLNLFVGEEVSSKCENLMKALTPAERCSGRGALMGLMGAGRTGQSAGDQPDQWREPREVFLQRSRSLKVIRG